MSSQKNNSMLCPGCRALISRREQQCPHCRMNNPGSWLKNNKLYASFLDSDQFLQLILYTNIGMFILSIIINPGRVNFNFNPFGFLSPSNQSLLVLGGTGAMPIQQMGRWWTLVSASYLHGGLLHIIFNMIALKQLGPLVAREFGTHRMLTIYTVGGIMGYLLSYLAGVRFTIGASAAVCSLIGAMLFYGKSRGGVYGQAVYSQIGGWAISIVIFGVMIPGINNWAHGGGMAAGAAVAYLLGYRESTREKPWHRFLGFSCGVITLMVLVWACFNGLVFALLR